MFLSGTDYDKYYYYYYYYWTGSGNTGIALVVVVARRGLNDCSCDSRTCIRRKEKHARVIRCSDYTYIHTYIYTHIYIHWQRNKARYKAC